MKRAIWLLLAIALVPLAGAAQTRNALDTTVIYVVRHAEKAHASHDPSLSSHGQERAARLARMLRDAGIDAIHSTPYRRTQETAAPLARALGVQVQVYAPATPQTLIERIRSDGRRHLIVGHSNTIGDLVARLGGDAVGNVLPKEFDRLYIVTRTREGATSVLLRY